MDIQANLESIQHLSKQAASLDDNTRQQLVIAAKQLVSSLEHPEKTILRATFEVHSLSLAIRLGVDLNIFKILADRDGNPISAAELAQQCKAEKLLIIRIMRQLTADNFAAESAESEYVATPISKAMTQPQIRGWTVHCHDLTVPSFQKTADWLKINGYKVPTDGLNCPWQYAHHTPHTFFGLTYADPIRKENFNWAMKATEFIRREWFEWYPVQERLFSAPPHPEHPDAPLMLDMGGGLGHQLERVLKKFPETKGRLLLQDLETTLEMAKGDLSEGIDAMVHDLLTPQPVKGARVYYCHWVFHDFPDSTVREMMRNIAKGMTPGYSRLVINEAIVPGTGCPSAIAALDLAMMSLLAGTQRSLAHWTELIEAEGLKVVHIGTSPDAGDIEGIIEVEVPVA